MTPETHRLKRRFDLQMNLGGIRLVPGALASYVAPTLDGAEVLAMIEVSGWATVNGNLAGLPIYEVNIFFASLVVSPLGEL